MARYEEGLTLAEARERYFVENGFNPAYDDRWVKARLGRYSVPLFPNTRARVAAARIHDVHHVATDYETTWVGEGGIAAWELASGCGPYLAAWVLNLTAFGIGFCLSPRRMLRAFLRGRRSKNFYAQGFDAARLAQKVGDMRHELALDRAATPGSPTDLALFGLWVVLSFVYAFAGMLSFVTFAVALWKVPPSAAARLPAPCADSDASASPAE